MDATNRLSHLHPANAGSRRFDQRRHRSTGVAISRHHTGCSATLNYSLSKRTMVYAEGVYQRANSDAQAAINGIMDPSASSSSASQAIARGGLRTAF